MRAVGRITALAATLALVACESASDVYVDVGVESGRCATCHLREYLSVDHPIHAGVKPTTCGICHSQTSWHPMVLSHPFVLDGAHAKVDCAECHRGSPPIFQGTSPECVGCHRADYDRSRFPGHNRFPLTCAECHSTTAWKPTLERQAPAQLEPRTPGTVETIPTRPPVPPSEMHRIPTAEPASAPTHHPPTSARPTHPSAPPPPPDTTTGASRRRR